MNLKSNVKILIASSIQNAMLRMAEISVGKSYPFGVHEIEIPEEVSQWAKLKRDLKIIKEE